MLLPIRKIREHIEPIPDIFFPFDPQDVFRGHEPALELWRRAELLWEDADDDFLQSEMPDPLVGMALEEDGEDGEPTRDLDQLFEWGAEIDAEQLVEALGGSEGERIRQSVLQHGVEALAWYVPYHAEALQWGVYIPVSSVLYMAAEVYKGSGGDVDKLVRLGFRCLHQHELFHFATEYMSTQWEAIAGRPCYRPARELKDQALGYNLLEEELANGHMLRACRRRVPNGTSRLRQWVQKCPPGYREGEKRVRASDFIAGCEKLARNYIGKISGFDRRYLGAVSCFELFPITPHIDWRYCPVHIIHDESRLNLSPFSFQVIKSIENIEEPENFQKMVAKQPQRVRESWEEAKKLLATDATASKLRFKPWDYKKAKGKPRNPNLYRGKKVYAVYLEKGFRAHIARLEDRRWSAVEIGTHKDLGHG
jgi:hypothetical protein